jgi:hypothetical protein
MMIRFFGQIGYPVNQIHHGEKALHFEALLNPLGGELPLVQIVKLPADLVGSEQIHMGQTSA